MRASGRLVRSTEVVTTQTFPQNPVVSLKGRYGFLNLGGEGVMSRGKSGALDERRDDRRGETRRRESQILRRRMEEELEVHDGANKMRRTASTVNQWFLFLPFYRTTFLSGVM